MPQATAYFNQLNQDYLSVHRRKEDLFWSTYMATSNEQKQADDAEKEWNQFISNSQRIGEIKQHLAQLAKQASSEETDAVIHGLKGWLQLFETNAFEAEESQAQKNKLIDMESELFKAKQAYKMSFIDDGGKQVEASGPTLAAAIGANSSSRFRRIALSPPINKAGCI